MGDIKVGSLVLKWVKTQYESESDHLPVDVFVRRTRGLDKREGNWVVTIWVKNSRMGYSAYAISQHPNSIRAALRRAQLQLQLESESLSRSDSFLRGLLSDPRQLSLWDHL